MCQLLACMSTVEIVCGSYEGNVVGYSLTWDEIDAASASPPLPLFAEAQHDGCVRALACGGGLMATGGTDNSIAVYNLRKRRSHGKLLQETGGSAIHTLAFHEGSHLISGCADGELSIWRTSDWECLLRMKGHKAAVLGVAIHPSGRVALSVGADKKLMLWNLTTGAMSHGKAPLRHHDGLTACCHACALSHELTRHATTNHTRPPHLPQHHSRKHHGRYTATTH